MIISLRVQSRVQRRRHISVQIQPSLTAFLVFTPGADPKPTRLNLNRRGCVMRFVAAMVTALFFNVSVNIENSIVFVLASSRLF